jgi:hypothetical protein
MQAAFGLVGLLVAMFIVAWLWATYTAPVAKVARPAQQQANTLAGRSANGAPAVMSAKFAPVQRNGTLSGIRIVAVDPTGALVEHFGLMPGDVVLRIGPFKMGDETLNDFESGRDWIVEGMQRQMDIVVNRGGTEITLPAQRNFLPAPSGAAGAAGANGSGASTPAQTPAGGSEPQ